MSGAKRVLIISYYFAPQNTIGAVRPTKLAKYLQRMGHEVTVICGSGMDDRQDPTLQKDLIGLKDVRVLREWNPLKNLKRRKRGDGGGMAAGGAAAATASVKAARSEESPRHGIVQRIANSAYLFLWVLADRSFQRLGKRELKKLNGAYDAVFSSYSPMSTHEIAALAKKRGLAKRWVADFRDEMDVSFCWQRPQRRRLWRKLEQADELTAVSEGTLKAMGIENKARVLCNGFDREDVGAVAVPPKDGFFRAVYCGQFHMGRKGVGDRDLTPIFAAMARLAKEGALDPARLKLCYAGGEGETFTRYAASCGLEGCVELHGSVSREESLRLQGEADLLLMASWNLRSQTGILTGKLFEYLMINRPIVCYMSGDVAGSELKALLAETGSGFCAEQAAGEEEALYEYLKALLARWAQNEALQPERNDAAVERYSYSQRAQRLAELMELEK